MGTTLVTADNGDVVDSNGRRHPGSEPTALSVVCRACRLLDLPFEIADTRLGLYLVSIGGEQGSWQYRINHKLPMVGAREKAVQNGDEVVWFFDPNGCMRPLRISLQGTNAKAGKPFWVRVEQYNDEQALWIPASTARVTFGSRDFAVTDGIARICLDAPGTFLLWAEKTDFVRSPAGKLIVTPFDGTGD